MTEKEKQAILCSAKDFFRTRIAPSHNQNTLKLENLSEFNAQFTKYESYQDENGKWQNTCRAQDVVTIANLAKENNNKYEYTVSDANTGYYYVKVIVKTGHKTRENFEIASLDDYTSFLKDYSGNVQDGAYNVTYFKCIDIKLNQNSQRVCSVTFEQM